VTKDNKAEYVRLVPDVKLFKAIEKQIAAFKDDFRELIPLEDYRICNEVELELLTFGLPDIDVSDLKASVEYSGFTPGSPQVNWLWTAISRMGQEDVARLVMFVTGTSKVPLHGSAALQGIHRPQKFQINRASGDNGRLPSAHTCLH
jgi:HECT-domain (ubiquitin-transferase)